MDDINKKYPEGHFLGMWMGICMVIFSGFGISFSFIIKNPGFIGMGPALGVAVGLAIGQSIENKYKREGRIRPLTESEKKRKKNAVFAGLVIFSLGILFFIIRFFL
jgi:hypothetical protein